MVARLEELAATGVAFTLVSEELGERSFGADTPRLVLDPIDGSMNAKRGVPFFSVSLAVAEGPTMADVVFGDVFDFGTREEWTARRGEGAFLNGAPLTGPGPKEDGEILSFEATLTDSIAQQIGDMVGFAPRTRVMGSLALTLCHMAAGRVDAVCSLKPARSVDIAAAQLLGDERELDAGRGKLLQARDDGALGSGVDGGRLIPSFACSNHGLPLEPRGVFGEYDV